MNTLNKIHYAVTITLNNDGQDNANIGMEGGAIRYVTDGVDLSSGYTYEDLTPVTDTFYTNIVQKGGFGKMGSSIDIAAGGDYGFLQSFNLSLINQTADGTPYHKAIEEEDTFVVGGFVKVYVIIDNVLYTRWSGSVSGVTFTDEKFTWNCEDSHATNNTTINSVGYGLIKQVVIVDTADNQIEPVASTPLTRLKFDHINEQYNPNDEEEYGYSSMSTDQTTKGVSHSLSDTRPRDSSEYDPNWNGKDSQLDSNRYQCWFQYDSTIDMTEVRYVKIGESDFYPVLAYDDIVDEYGNDMQRVLIEGECPIDEDVNQFGNYESLLTGTAAKDATEDFEGTVIALYDKGVQILEGVNVDNIDSLVDSAGNEIDKGIIVKIGDNYYLPFNIKTYKKYAIPNNKISYYYDNDTTFDAVQNSKFTNSYTGLIEPTGEGWCAHMLIDVSSHGLVLQEYDKVFLGNTINRLEQERKFYGFKMSGLLNDPASYYIFDYWTGGSGGTSNPLCDIVSLNNDGSLTAGTSENSSTRFTQSFVNKINFDIGTMYNDKKYGLVYDSSTSVVEGNTPLGQSVVVDFLDSGPTYGASITFYQYGGTNEPIVLGGNRFGLPLILGANGFPISYPTDRNTRWSGIGNGAYNREFQFLEVAQSTDWTAPDISNQLSKNPFIILSAYGEKQSANTYFYRNDGSTPAFDSVSNPSTNLVGIPSYIDFSLIGEKNNDAADIYAKISNGNTDTIGKMLADLTGSTTVSSIRPTYYTGGFLIEQINKYKLITDLCRQGFIGGYTDRTGETIFKKIGEFDSVYKSHNDDNILDNSIKNFKHTPISKVYNEFEVKYCYVDGAPEKTLELHNVDQNTFPANPSAAGDLIQNVSFFNYSDLTTCTSGEIKILEEDYIRAGYSFSIGDTVELSMGEDGSGGMANSGDFIGTISDIRYEHSGPAGGTVAVLDTTADVGTTLQVLNPSSTTFPLGVTLYSTTITAASDNFNSNEEFEWKTWVVGVDDYNTAKKLWEKAHSAYLVTGVIQKAPSNRTDLKWAVEKNWFENNNNNDSSQEYGFDYFVKLIDWTTYQKFQVNYSLPITEENLKLELLESIQFSDPIITPDFGEVGEGWITNYSVNPSADVINIQLTFSPEFYVFARPTAVVDCNTITEQFGNVDTITEDESNTDTITEQECN